MITGKTKTEATYRAITLDSSSSLKDFSMDKRKYYKKYILNTDVIEEEDDNNKAAVTGRVVETLLLEPHEFDNRFYLSICLNSPTGLMLEFVNSLYRYTLEATDEAGSITREFEDICKDAYTNSGFKIKFDAVLNKFIGSDAEVYYKEMREVKSKNLTIVTTTDITNAERIVEELKTNFVTANIVNLITSDRWEVRNQFQIEGYDVDGHLFKSMTDKVVIDHKEKTIQVYDLKCTWSVEKFYEEYYLYRRSYIQAYLYNKAMIYTTQNEEKLKDYTVLAPKFIVCDSINYYNPLIYTLNDKDLDDGYLGFEYKGKKYVGVKKIIEDLKWAQEHNIWNMAKDSYLNNGVVNIKG